MSIYIQNKLQNIDKEKIKNSIEGLKSNYYNATHKIPDDSGLDLMFIKTACYFDKLIDDILELVYGGGIKIPDGSRLEILKRLVGKDEDLTKKIEELRIFFSFRNKFAHDVGYYASKDNDFVTFINNYIPTDEEKKIHPYIDAKMANLVKFSKEILNELFVIILGLRHDHDFILYEASEPHSGH